MTFRQFLESVQIGDRITRFTHRNGMGMLNRMAFDTSRLSDDEELELPSLLDYGMQQPRDVPPGHKFYFTDEGLKKHAKLIRLISKASIYGGLVKEVRKLDVQPSWVSSDGQIAIPV